MMRFFATTLMVLASTPLAVCAQEGEAGSGALWQARTKAAEARQKTLSAASAGRSGNAEKYQRLESEAEAGFEEAKRLFEAAGGMELRDTEALADFAQVLEATGDADLAAEALKRAVELAPGDPGLRLLLGRALLAPLYTREEQARKALEEAVRLGEGTDAEADARTTLGLLFWRKGLYEFAEEEWRRAVEVSPQNGRAQVGLAAADVRRGHMVAASRRIQESIQGDAQALALMPQLMRTALEDFERSGWWFEDTAEAQLAYAGFLLRAGRFTESLGPLSRAVKLDPDNTVAWNMLGSVSAQMQNADRAREAFEKSLALDPDQPRTKQALQALPKTESDSAEEEGAGQGSGAGSSSGTSK